VDSPHRFADIRSMSSLANRIRTVDHRHEPDSWRMDSLLPSATLSPFMRRATAYTVQGAGLSRQRELPNGSAVLVFNLGTELRVEDATGKLHRFPHPTAFYSGPSDRYVVTETDGAQEGMVVELTLPGARRLLGRPLNELGDRMISLADLLGRRADEILGRIIEAPSPAARLALLESAIEARIADAGDGGTRDLEWAWNLQHARGGRMPVSDLADVIGCSRKHLAVRFDREFGLSPKRLARIMRFDRAVRVVRFGEVTSWSDLAAQCGFADQAHMAREFVAFAGDPPTALLRRRLPDDGGFVD
jgi:AraC-like DNA-binding protein